MPIKQRLPASARAFCNWPTTVFARSLSRTARPSARHPLVNLKGAGLGEIVERQLLSNYVDFASTCIKIVDRLAAMFTQKPKHNQRVRGSDSCWRERRPQRPPGSTPEQLLHACEDLRLMNGSRACKPNTSASCGPRSEAGAAAMSRSSALLDAKNYYGMLALAAAREPPANWSLLRCR